MRLGSARLAGFGAVAMPLNADSESGAAADRGGADFVAAVRVNSPALDTRGRDDAAAPPLSNRSAVPAAGLTSARGFGSTGSAGRVDAARARAAGRSLSPGGVVESVTAPYPFAYDPC